MKDFVKMVYRKILKKLPTKVVLNLDYFKGYHRFVNFKKPKYFGEKIQYLKLYGNLEKYKKYVDKYEVRKYIKNTIGEKYLIPLIGVYKNTNEIDYNLLPNKFVLKLNTGSGYNIVVTDKSRLDINKANKKLNRWIKEDFASVHKEPQYKNINIKILCEQFMSGDSEELTDYKFFCFNGIPKFCQVIQGRNTKETIDFYDMKWEHQEFNGLGKFKMANDCKKPANFDEMVNISKKLCKEFDFVRVDLYDIGNKVYFGELTFTPADGAGAFYPIEYDLKIASLLKVGDKK